jgi:hypothetical protein
MVGRGSGPSHIDNPRFADDDALSTWTFAREAVVGSKRDLGPAKQYARRPKSGSPHMEPKHASDPIGIEIVRVANGSSSDDWVVVVDGMRCTPTPSANHSNTFTCKLPGGVELKPITADTRVRPVAVAIRLEAEALAPLFARVSLTQILTSDERDSRQESDEKSMGEPVELHPYRVSDNSAKAVTLPYPFCAPAQSALGILSMKPKKPRGGKGKRHIGLQRVYNRGQHGVEAGL